MLEVELKHTFDNFTLDAQFQAPAGITVLFGRSGSGKTSVINAVAGLFSPHQGAVRLDGETLLDTVNDTSIPTHQRHVGYIFQEDRLFPHLDVSANLNFATRFTGGHPGPHSLDNIVALLGIGHLLKRGVSNLSGGERQRVAIGRAILANPKLILADEPLTGLDEGRKADILPYFERLRDELEIPMLYVSHDVAEVARLATTVVVLEAGKVTRQGTAQQVLGDPLVTPLGVGGIGALLETRIHQHHDDGLTELKAADASLLVPGLTRDIGTRIRVRIPAHDVLISLQAPHDISALNVLPGVIANLETQPDGSVVAVIDTSAGRILSRVTKRSTERLQLAPGTNCFAIIKTVAIAPD